jgi:hypothetical protein
MDKGKRKIKKSYVPDTLTKSQKQKQVKSIRNKTDRPKLDIKTRRSKWTIKAEKYFGKGKTSVDDISKRLKVPKKGLEEIIQKGKAAYYNSGSRPNQTAFSWSQARLYSVLFGGPSRKIDQAIVEKYKIPLLK